MATEQREEAFAVICRRFGVSRRVGYKWLARYQEAGVEGLFDRPRAPRHHPQTIADEIAERCLAVRRRPPGWGPPKVRGHLEPRLPALDWPAAGPIGALFHREGYTGNTQPRLRRT